MENIGLSARFCSLIQFPIVNASLVFRKVYSYFHNFSFVISKCFSVVFFLNLGYGIGR